MGVKNFLKYTFLFLFKSMVRIIYVILCKIKPLNANKMVISVYRSEKLEGNLLYIYNEIRKKHPDIQIERIYPNNKFSLSLFKDLISICDAKYIVLDDYFLPIYLIKPKHEVKVIQLWHAAGAFKKFGYSTIGKSFSADKNYLKIVPLHSNYTHVYVSSNRISSHYAEAFNMDEDKIYPKGMPRTDYFFDTYAKNKSIKEIKEKYGDIIKEKVVILFAPTYRADNNQQESNIDHVEIVQEISRKINEDKIIVFKPHPYVLNNIGDELKQLKNVLVVNNEFILNEWMLISDALITDYSSSIFEYAILNRPLAHFVPDLEQYETNRGLYYPINEISDGSILQNIQELIDWINGRTIQECFNTDRMVAFNFSKLENVSQNIVKHFIHK